MPSCSSRAGRPAWPVAPKARRVIARWTSRTIVVVAATPRPPSATAALRSDVSAIASVWQRRAGTAFSTPGELGHTAQRAAASVRVGPEQPVSEGLVAIVRTRAGLPVEQQEREVVVDFFGIDPQVVVVGARVGVVERAVEMRGCLVEGWDEERVAGAAVVYRHPSRRERSLGVTVELPEPSRPGRDL